MFLVLAGMLWCTPYTGMTIGGTMETICFKLRPEQVQSLTVEHGQDMIDKAEQIALFMF